MNRFHTFVSLSIVALSAQSVCAHMDFIPGISNNQVVTSGRDDLTNEFVESLIVNGYDFGEVEGDPYNIGDPGFNTGGPSAFSTGSTLRLAGLAVDGRFLSYWNGAGDPSFGSPAAGTSLVISGSPTRFVTFTESSISYAPTSPASLLIGTFSTGGSLHSHVSSSLLLNNLQEPDSIPVGAYLLSFSLSNPSTGVMDSDSLFVVYNNGLDESVHDAAIDFVSATYVPEPTMLMVALAALPLLARRRS
ncbi:MAG TPA: hypothetical protein PK402_12390 [Tepidisphaeraceae bacterium]|nr:hypothetical protein [Tepidisphaeraceae bacterium]